MWNYLIMLGVSHNYTHNLNVEETKSIFYVTDFKFLNSLFI